MATYSHNEHIEQLQQELRDKVAEILDATRAPADVSMAVRHAHYLEVRLGRNGSFNIGVSDPYGSRTTWQVK